MLKTLDTTICHVCMFLWLNDEVEHSQGWVYAYGLENTLVFVYKLLVHWKEKKIWKKRIFRNFWTRKFPFLTNILIYSHIVCITVSLNLSMSLRCQTYPPKVDCVDFSDWGPNPFFYTGVIHSLIFNPDCMNTMFLKDYKPAHWVRPLFYCTAVFECNQRVKGESKPSHCNQQQVELYIVSVKYEALIITDV